jgi:hypothetical protein
MERGQWREKFREDLIAFIDTWREEHPEASFITHIEVPKVLDVVAYEYTLRHHRAREKRGKNEHGEYL